MRADECASFPALDILGHSKPLPGYDHEFIVSLWVICRNRDACHLRPGSQEQVVHSGVCFCLCPGLGLRFPSGCLAIRPGRSYLVRRCRTSMVAQESVAQKNCRTMCGDHSIHGPAGSHARASTRSAHNAHTFSEDARPCRSRLRLRPTRIYCSASNSYKPVQRQTRKPWRSTLQQR
jgi:hypothetical protein